MFATRTHSYTSAFHKRLPVQHLFHMLGEGTMIYQISRLIDSTNDLSSPKRVASTRYILFSFQAPLGRQMGSHPCSSAPA